MEIPITTEAPMDPGGTSVIKDLDGNLLVQRADLPAMTIRPGTVTPDTWAMLSAKARPTPSVPDIGVVPTTPGMPPSMALPPPAPEKFGPPTLVAPQENGGGVSAPPSAPPVGGAAGFAGLIGNSPRLMAQQDKAFADAKAANAESAELEGLRATEEAALQRKANAEIERRELAAQTQRDYLANRLELEERKRNQAVEEVRSMKVDPGRFWASKSTGDKVRLTIASVFGAIGASFSHGPNYVADALHREVDADIDAQKNNIMNAKEGVSMHNNLVAQMRQKGLDFDQAVLTAKQMKLEQVKRQIDILGSEYKGPESAARATALNAAMDQKLADLKIQQDNAMKARLTHVLDKMPAPGGKAINESTAKELGEANSATKNAQDILKQFNGSAEGFGGWLMSFLPMNDASRYEDRAKVAAQVIGSYLEGGKLTDPDFKRYLSELPQPGDGKEKARNKVDALVKLISTRQASQKAALAGSGYNVRGIKDAAPLINFKPTGG